MSAARVVRPAVLGDIPVGRCVVIEASAGTGKTFTLEHLVVEILLSTEVTLDRLLVVTFTEKATHELRTRLRSKLEALRAAAATPTAADAAAGGDVWILDEHAQRRMELALRSFDGATITTIHAFCQRVLRDNAFFSGRMFREQHVDGRDAFLRAIPEALRRVVARDPLRAPWMKAALGTGWSMTRIQELLWRFTQQRGDLRPRVEEAQIRRALEAFPAQTARRTQNADELRGWGMHPATAKKAARRLYELADLVERTRADGEMPDYVLGAADADFPYLLDKLPPEPPRLGPVAALTTAALELIRMTPTFPAALVQALLPPVRAELGRRKWEAGQYDFDDMLELVDEALRGPRGSALASAMRERWRYVLIDEFQDTDETQWSIFRRGFLDRSQAPSAVCLVGDPKQSIYRFRGADVDTYLRARAEVLADGGSLAVLDSNYRATPDLVGAINAIFDQQASSPVFSGSLRHAPVACGRPDRTMVDGSGRPVSPVQVMEVHAGLPTALPALGAWIASEIRTITDPVAPWRLDGKPVGPGDVFVLTRTGREGRVLGTALRTAGVPHTFYKLDGLFQTDEAKDLRALLTAIDDPGHRALRVAAWLTPFFGLPLHAIDRARDLPSNHPLVARLLSWKAIADTRDFDRLFDAIRRDSGFVRREIFFGQGERELTNFLHLFELLLEYAHAKPSTLGDLVLTLSGLIEGTRLPLDYEGNVQRVESDRPAVQIMTIHKAKGLEAPIVFVVGGFGGGRTDEVRVYHDEERRLAWVGPATDRDVDARAKLEEREEDQRLMYVALTRAKGRLYLPLVAPERAAPSEEGSPRDSRAVRGSYAIIQRRLGELLDAGAPFLTTVDVPVTDAASSAPPTAGPPRGWAPPAGLLRQGGEPDLAVLRRTRLGPLVTSYTRMRGEGGLTRTVSRGAAYEPRADAADGELRGARASGVFLHEVLERVPLESFSPELAIGAWRTRDDVSPLFDEAMAAHRIDRAQRAHAEQLVWNAYTTPLSLPGGGRVEGIARARRIVREMDFVFPAEAPGTAAKDRSVRTYVRGAIDLAFEHDGATYFVDWKSDSLASYTPASLERHVVDHYEAQARLYAVAVARLLGDGPGEDRRRRFGGMLFCFLRGLDAAGSGVWTSRPSPAELGAWERELAGLRVEGGQP